MQVIEKVASLPIIRPLAVEDKIDIINLARKINTYDISIRPYEDCCTIFEVKDPTTQPNEEKVLEFESKFNYEELIYECINNIEVVKITDEEDLDNLF